MAVIVLTSRRRMHYVGVKELKNRLTHYLRLVKNGDNVIITERGKPKAILQGIHNIKDSAGTDEKLARLAGRGLLRLPKFGAKFQAFKAVKVEGKSASQILIEDRR